MARVAAALTALIVGITQELFPLSREPLELRYRLLTPDQYCPAERALWQHSFLGC